MKPKFELDLSNSVKDNILRILHEQYTNIIEYCKNQEKDPDKAVHEIRKSFKRIRASLRLIRDEIGYSTYYRENAFCRDEAKLISDLRDLKVFHEDLGYLAKAHNDSADLKLIELLQEEILNRKDQRFSKVYSEQVFQTIIQDVKAAMDRIKLLHFKHDNFQVIVGGLYRIYKQGQKELELVKKEPTTENYHDLRKRVKYLMYFAQILKPVYPQYFKGMDKMLDKASDQLGIDHNYAELIRFVEGLKKRGVTQKRKADFISWLQALRSQLQDPALESIQMVYVETPEDFINRVKKYFEITYSVN